MAQDYFAGQEFARTAAERIGKIDTTAIAAAALQNVTPFDTTALRDTVLQNLSAFDTLGLTKWENPAMGTFQRITDQITTPAFAQMQDQIRAMTYAPVIDSIATPALGQMREQIHAMAYSPAMDSITAAMLPDTAWMAPYLRTVDTVALFDTMYSVQSPITNMLDQMSESVRSQFFVSGAMTDTLVTSQFEKMMDSIEDIASPATMDEFRDTVIAPNVASILDNIVNTVDEDMIDEIEDFMGAISQEQEAFVADLIAANPTLKAKVQAR